MKTKLRWLFLLVVAVLVAGFIYVLMVQSISVSKTFNQQPAILPPTLSQFPQIAMQLADKIEDISLTQSFDELGWILQKVSFVRNSNLAYLEYTDTHVTLRTLVTYKYDKNQIEAKVLATFLPDEMGVWQLQYGKDPVYNQSKLDFVLDGHTSQWIAQVSESD